MRYPWLSSLGVLMAIGLWLHLAERHEHEHVHEEIEHEHRHGHDAITSMSMKAGGRAALPICTATSRCGTSIRTIPTCTTATATATECSSICTRYSWPSGARSQVQSTALPAAEDWNVLLAMMPLGIVFGAAHAMTPGHSKSILATYVLGSGLRPLRAVLTSLILAATHITSAVLLAVITNTLVTRTLVGAGRAPALEN